jgi:hypothetical protein
MGKYGRQLPDGVELSVDEAAVPSCHLQLTVARETLLSDVLRQLKRIREQDIKSLRLALK